MRPVLPLRSPLTDLVIGISPFQEPDAGLAEAVCRAGALGVLDLGAGDRRSREELAALRERSAGPFGVRVGAGCRLSPAELRSPDGAAPDTVVLAVDAPAWDVQTLAARYRLLVEVTDLEQALAAVRAGAHGLIARGSESGGRVGELSTYVLLQQLLGAPEIELPVWACGGIGLRTAAAAVAGGAAGVVLDSQLALLAESAAPQEVAAAVRGMDGSETAVVEGRRVLVRNAPGASVDRELAVGQDGFLASSFADRWGTVGRAVRAVREAVLDGMRAPGGAVALLGPGAPMSRALGTELPVAQGPIDRKSVV